MKSIVVALAVVACTGSSFAADAVSILSTPLPRINRTVTGQPIVVPPGPDVLSSIVTIAPGGRLPEHRHPYPHFVYVLEGTLTLVNTVTNTSQDFAQGRFIAEPIGTWHYGVNKGSTTLQVLGIDEVPAGTKSNVELKSP